MSKRSNKAEAILDSAEQMARNGGYMGFSFREIAKDVGIKAASVHYHFPGKEDLGAALAERYTERFMAALGDPGDEARTPDRLLAAYVQAYRSSLVDDGLMCLCGMFGSEVQSLPPAVATKTKSFFEQNLTWLETVLARRDPKAKPKARRSNALKIIATLEGAMIVARTLEDPAAFDQIVGGLVG